MTKFGDNLRNLCKVKKITQQALSKKTKDLGNYINVRTINKYINTPDTYPRLHHARTLAEALEVSMDILFDEEGISENFDNDIYNELRTFLSYQGQEKLRMAELYMDYLLATQEAPCKEK